MPTYEYRCKNCGRKVSLFYKTYKQYDEATPTCTHCGSADLSRLISRVAIAKPGRDFSSMSETEMLNVLEGGNPQEMGRMMQQVMETAGGDASELGPEFQEATSRLLKGENPESIEKDLGASLGGSLSDEV